MTLPLTLHRGCEQHASLVGPAAIVDTIARTSGLVSRECVDDLRHAIDHADERVLHDAITRAGCDPVASTCALCDSMRRGKCAAHRETSLTMPLTARGVVTYP